MASLMLRAARLSSRRTFTTSAVCGKGRSKSSGTLHSSNNYLGTLSNEKSTDLIQDLYLKELRAYKAPPPAADAHVGIVKAFQAPPTPQPPASPVNLASDLAAYEAAEPSIDQAAPVKTSAVSAEGQGAQEFLAFLEADLPKHEAHH